MISIRQSFLEAFGRAQETEYGDEAALRDAIRGQPHPPTPIMQAGTAWHSILAGPIIPIAGFGEWIQADDYRFGVKDIQRAADHVGPGLCEVPGEITWYRPDRWGIGHDVCLTGTCDHLCGLMCSDHKTKFSTPDSRDYELSLQWRIYLLLHDCTVFRYNLFHFKDPTPEGYCELKDIVSVRYWRYPGMEADVLAWLGRFVEWAGALGLLPYLDSERIAA